MWKITLLMCVVSITHCLAGLRPHSDSGEYDNKDITYNRKNEKYDRSNEKYDRNSEEYDRDSKEYERDSKEYERDSKEYDRDSKEYERDSEEYDKNDRRRTRNEIYTPCKLDDMECIRKEMADHSDCNGRVYGSVPDPVAVPHFKFRAAFFNSSFYDQFLVIRNLKRCVVSAFYTNKTSDTTIFGLDCPNIDFEANRTAIHHRELKDDIIYKYKEMMVYRLLRMQVVFRASNALDLCGTQANPFVSEVISLKAVPYDKASEEFIKRDTLGIFKRHRTIYDREVALYAVNVYVRLFVNNLICNFHCKSLFNVEK